MSVNFREDGLELYKEGRYAAALESFLSEETDPAEDSELAYYMGLCHVRLDEREEAIGLLRQVIRHEVHLARLYQARMLLSWLMVEADDIEGAENNLRELLQEGFFSPQAWAALGYCQWRRGRTDLALESYQEAISLDQENSNAVNGLGYLLADSGEDPQKAVDLCRKALERDPDNAAYRDSLGWALFRAGKPLEAVRYLTEALSDRPDDEIIKSHLEAVRTHEQPDL
ncbi:MAG: tetratricopeptide repeat protein [Spirochaetaceae bacterium]|nr:tetratricopeptide repeat protein [Spirochaetaceae bacterium]MDT8297185.1 tetratricopeptide repeat protein [Spirochaetaceae bacterium]